MTDHLEEARKLVRKTAGGYVSRADVIKAIDHLADAIAERLPTSTPLDGEVEDDWPAYKCCGRKSLHSRGCPNEPPVQVDPEFDCNACFLMAEEAAEQARLGWAGIVDYYQEFRDSCNHERVSEASDDS